MSYCRVYIYICRWPGSAEEVVDLGAGAHGAHHLFLCDHLYAGAARFDGHVVWILDGFRWFFGRFFDDFRPLGWVFGSSVA